MASVRVYAANGILKYGPGDHGELTGLADDDHIQYPLIASSATHPTNTPARVGLIHVDTTRGVEYYSKGNSSSADWLKDISGWEPYVVPGYAPVVGALTTGIATLAANGGSLAIPVRLVGHMLLQSVMLQQRSASLARSWGWDLYAQSTNTGDSAENTLSRIAASNGNDSFTASGNANRTLDASSAPVYLGPGVYWIVIQCRHASNAFEMTNLTSSNGWATGQSFAQTKTTTNPNGATLDLVAASWTKIDGWHAVSLQGRVFGQTAAF